MGSKRVICRRVSLLGETGAWTEYLAIPLESGECVRTGKNKKEESRVGRSEEEFVIFLSFRQPGLNT